MDFPSLRPVPSAGRGSARRHRVQGGRPCVVQIRFTDAEYAALATRATESKVSVQRYLTNCALTRRPHPPPPSVTAELAALRRLTSNLANNINQIARRLNSGGALDASTGPTLEAVRRTMDRLDRALAGTDPGSPGSPRNTAPLLRPSPGRSP
jgi:Bacterial mobilisation protein (MobC)